MNLCQIGLINHQWIPIFKEDRTTYRCRSCKKNYDAEILGTDICPECGKVMGFRGFTFYRCKICGRLK